MAIEHGTTHVWTKSSHSGGNGACLEASSPARDLLAVRDSKDPAGPGLGFPAGSWSAFLGAVARARRR
jgi:hypothetical protein